MYGKIKTGGKKKMDKKIIYTRLNDERVKELKKMIKDYNDTYKPAILLKQASLLEVALETILKEYRKNGVEAVKTIILNNS